MKEYIQKAHDKFDALQQREKIMVAGLLFVLLYVLWQLLFFDAATINENKYKSQIKTQQGTNKAISGEITAYRDRVNDNPNVKLQKQKRLYLSKITVLDEKLNKKMKGLISPKKMTLMLKDIFKSNVSLTLISLDKLSAQSIFDFSEKNKPQQSGNERTAISVTDNVTSHESSNAMVYRHPVQIVFTGSYLNTLAYLEAIEEMPWDLYWDSVQLDVEKYPKSKIVITVFTLSLKKGWIGV